MSGYFKRMAQLGRSGRPRRAAPGPLMTSDPVLQEVAIEVPAAPIQPAAPKRIANAPGPAAQALSQPARQPDEKKTSPANSDAGPAIARTVPQSIPAGQIHTERKRGAPVSRAAEQPPPDSPRPRAEAPTESSPPPRKEPVAAQAQATRQDEPGPITQQTFEHHTQAVVQPLPPAEAERGPRPFEDTPQEIERKEPQAQVTSEAVPHQPEPAPSAEAVPLPAERPPVSATPPTAIVQEDRLAPTLPGPKARPDIEVTIGAVNLSLDPEPAPAQAAPPQAPPAPAKPRAGGIWTDGRRFARSYLRRL